MAHGSQCNALLPRGERTGKIRIVAIKGIQENAMWRYAHIPLVDFVITFETQCVQPLQRQLTHPLHTLVAPLRTIPRIIRQPQAQSLQLRKQAERTEVFRSQDAFELAQMRQMRQERESACIQTIHAPNNGPTV
jgi:hypothetical protein